MGKIHASGIIGHERRPEAWVSSEWSVGEGGTIVQEDDDETCGYDDQTFTSNYQPSCARRVPYDPGVQQSAVSQS
ncbi:hypothetical protein K443DRAFT_683695 [Laccaria amethystina LaAM-08-1]|uniref:Uncharacterized protein n=1 Tax=Laccaria amethystina LaAM-08-1 TaxID=1095629 RepID=A0A0C9XA26_9AGAR|nr:hypothetical protein K443DRAFT_683695 [Laccaria amethystina LaAM-08-1]